MVGYVRNHTRAVGVFLCVCKCVCLSVSMYALHVCLACVCCLFVHICPHTYIPIIYIIPLDSDNKMHVIADLFVCTFASVWAQSPVNGSLCW